MLTEKQTRIMKIVGRALFALASFAAIAVSLIIINRLGNYEKSVGFLLLAAFGVTLIYTVEYALVRKPLLRMIEKLKKKYYR